MSRRRARRGSAATELALTAGLLVTLAVGFAEIGHLQDLGAVVGSVAADAAATGADVLDPTLPMTGAAMVAAAEQRATDGLADAGIACGVGCVVSATFTTVGGYNAVEVTVDVPYDAWTNLPFAPGSVRRVSVALTKLQDP